MGDSEDLRKEAEVLEMIRNNLASAYIAKTGLDREKVNQMMKEETWLTAQEAYDLKFCDEIEVAEEMVAMATNTGGFICKTQAGFSQLDDLMNDKISKRLKIKNRQESEKMMSEVIKPSVFMIENAVDLENQYPKIAGKMKKAAEEAGFKNGVEAERERLKALDSLNAPGREAIITKAKYEEPKDARDVAMEILQADKTQAKLNGIHNDASALDVVLISERTTPNAKADEEVARNMVVNELNKMRGYK